QMAGPLVVDEGERLIRPVVVCVRCVIAIVAAIVDSKSSRLPAVKSIQANVHFGADGSLLRDLTGRVQPDRRQSRLERGIKRYIRPDVDGLGGLSKARHRPAG